MAWSLSREIAARVKIELKPANKSTLLQTKRAIFDESAIMIKSGTGINPTKKSAKTKLINKK